jgi:hypothetical protein
MPTSSHCTFAFSSSITIVYLFIITTCWNTLLTSELCLGIAQEVSSLTLTAETRVQASVSPCGISGVQSGTGRGFPSSSTVFPCQYHSTVAFHIYISPETTCQPSTVWCSRERLPAAAAEPAQGLSEPVAPRIYCHIEYSNNLHLQFVRIFTNWSAITYNVHISSDFKFLKFRFACSLPSSERGPNHVAFHT